MKKIRYYLLICLFSLVFSTAFAAENESAALLAGDYGVDKATVQMLYQSDWSVANINHAAFLALATELPLQQVVDIYRANHDDWRQAEQVLGLTDWHIHQAQRVLIENQLYQIFATNRAGVDSALTQRYHPKAIALASGLINKVPADFDEILSKKKDGRSWYQVGEDYGIRNAEVDEIVQKLEHEFTIRAAIGDAYGYYGHDYGYQDADYYANGLSIEILNFAKPQAKK